MRPRLAPNPRPPRPQVLDRTQLILEIFSRRARTKEAKMQVELAKAEYMSSNIVTKEDVEQFQKESHISRSSQNKQPRLERQ